MTIQVDINLDMHPTSVDLVFPDGVPKGGTLELNLHRASSRFAYVNELQKSVPVVRQRPSVLDAHYLEQNITVSAFHEEDGHPLCLLRPANRDAGEHRMPPPPSCLSNEGAKATVCEIIVEEPAASDVVVVQDEVLQQPVSSSIFPQQLNPIYVCAVCNYQTRSEQDALSHMKNHEAWPPDNPEPSSHPTLAQENAIACERKQQKKDDKTNLLKTMRPRKKPQFKCTECNKQFPADGLLRIHMRVYHGGPLHCKLCSSKVRSERELEKHMQCEHAERALHQCSYCSQPFFNASLLAAHELKCPVAKLRNKTVACQLCDYTTAEANQMCQHIQEAHTEKVIYTCEPCGNLSLNYNLHQDHLQTHKPMTAQQQQPVATSSRLPKEPVKCPLCKKDFKNNRTLKEHIKRHPAVVRHVCEHCGEGITSNAALIKHMNHHNRQSVSRKYKCLFCSKGFQTSFSVSRHMRNIHLFEHEHGCDLCPHKFATVKEKAEHMAKVHAGPTQRRPAGRRMLVCTDCPFQTMSVGRFERHRASHTGVYPYECAECPRRFAAKEELNRHKHIIHPKDQLSCPHCPRIFQVSLSRLVLMLDQQ